jgi:hypothetical protein
MLLKYYLYQRENNPKSVEEIYQEAFEFRESTKKFVKEFDKNVKDRIKLLIDNDVNLELELNFTNDIYEIKEINNSILKSELRMSIKEILMNLIYNRQMNTKDTIKILSTLVFYFDKKYKSANKNNTINNIINNILQRINIYSTGYIIFDFLSEKIDRDEIKTEKDIDILYNLLLISFTCCNQIFIGTNNIHIQELNIDTLLQTYNKFLGKINKKRERNTNKNVNRNAKNIASKTKLPKAHSI